MENKIPLRLEQALDLILAIPAHRSSNANHAKFGNLVVEEYFIKLRDEYKNDKIAYMYLSNIFAAIASSVRAFSVQRDIFQTKWNTLGKVKNSIIERANRLDKYSPFNGSIGKVISLFISFGSSSVIVKSYNDLLQTIGKFAFWIPIVFVVTIFAFDFVLELYKCRLINEAEKTLPEDLMITWQEENTAQYRKILKLFLLNAIEIQKMYYPEEKVFSEDISVMTKEHLDSYLDKVIDRHMVF
jgi:hypothetical protein